MICDTGHKKFVLGRIPIYDNWKYAQELSDLSNFGKDLEFLFVQAAYQFYILSFSAIDKTWQRSSNELKADMIRGV